MSNLSKSIFRVIKQTKYRSFVSPWQPEQVGAGHATCFYIELNGNMYLITNQHVASEAIITLYKNGLFYNAACIAGFPEFDLAILEAEKDFYKDIVPLKPAKNAPKQKDKIYLAGYPLLKDPTLSISSGIISRLLGESSYDQFINISYQTTADANRGNSGGPALNKANEVLGVVRAYVGGSTGMSLFIPLEIVYYYVANWRNLKRMPDLPIEYTHIINDGMIKYFSLDKHSASGVVVQKIMPQNMGVMSTPFHINDAIISINGTPISNNGTIMSKLYDIEIPFMHYIKTSAPGMRIEFEIIRNGNKKIISVVPEQLYHLSPKCDEHLSNHYVICYGLGFTAFGLPLLEQYKRMKAQNYCHLDVYHNELEYESFEGSYQGKQEIVILTEVFPNPFIRNYSENYRRLLTVNDIRIFNLAHLHKLILELSGKFLDFRFDDNSVYIVDVRNVTSPADENKKITDTYSIASWYRI